MVTWLAGESSESMSQGDREFDSRRKQRDVLFASFLLPFCFPLLMHHRDIDLRRPPLLRDIDGRAETPVPVLPRASRASPLLPYATP